MRYTTVSFYIPYQVIHEFTEVRGNYCQDRETIIQQLCAKFSTVKTQPRDAIHNQLLDEERNAKPRDDFWKDNIIDRYARILKVRQFKNVQILTLDREFKIRIKEKNELVSRNEFISVPEFYDIAKFFSS